LQHLPSSFDEDLMEDWSFWVLDNGLPPLPTHVKPGESVPVARWAGPRYGAVLHIQWTWSDDHEDDSLSTETQVFLRRGDSWEVANGQGGAGWFDPPFVRPAHFGRGEVAIGNRFFAGESDWSCCAVDGLVGADAVAIEVADADGVTRRAVESPFGAVIACSDGDHEATFRVLDAQEHVLGSGRFGFER
jgi:hypothetical protein